jgi:hypothetical protein
MYFVWWNGVLIFFLIHCKFASYDALTFQHATALCYNNQFVALQNHVPFPKPWVVCETIVSILSPIVLWLCFEPNF